METKDYLHKKFRHTNRIFPIASHMLELDVYPEQMDIVGNIYELSYRYKDIQTQGYTTERVYAQERPKDDIQNHYDYRDSQEWKDLYVYTKEFLILRADSVEPYRFVAMSTDYADIIVCDSRHWEDEKYHLIPGQDEHYNGHMVRPYFIDRLDDDISEFVEAIPEARILEDNGYLEAYLFSADKSEPGYCVVISYYGESEFKVYLDDECLLELLPSPDLDDVRKNMKRFRRLIMGERTPYGATN